MTVATRLDGEKKTMGTSETSRTWGSGLATVSVVLAIIGVMMLFGGVLAEPDLLGLPTSITNGMPQGFILFGIISISTVICGHLARFAIRRSGGASGASKIALAGLIVGYVILTLTGLMLIAILTFSGPS